jgi:hypothetical protein
MLLLWQIVEANDDCDHALPDCESLPTPYSEAAFFAYAGPWYKSSGNACVE